jgi:hypothetical protein
MDMGMDEAVAKPQNNGLPRNWSAMMMGMMSLVRVLPPDRYDDVMRDIRNGYISPASSATDHPNHHHEGGGE